MLYVTAESVYAVFEVKQNLNSLHIEYAAKKAESVRKLFRSSVPITHAGGTFSSKPLHVIISGLLTATCDWVDPIDKNLVKHLENLPFDQRLDICCSLESSTFFIDYLEHKIDFQKNETDEILIFLYLRFLLKLQKIGTVPAIDLMQYAMAIDSI